MKILILGNGAREHALGHALTQDKRVEKLWFAPGNAGTASLGENIPISVTDIEALAQWAEKNQPDLTVVGPDAPLGLGVVDAFEARGLKIFGPNASAARLEGSKVFAKELFEKNGIPTAKSRKFSSSKEAIEWSSEMTCPQVIKADGLALGKGVIIAETHAEAETAIRSIIDDKIFGMAGSSILIEEFLVGEEMSVHAVTDGTTYRFFPSAQDHKRIYDNDKGPNTGGMGAYAPSPLFTPEMEARIRREIFDPLLIGLKNEGIDYKGVLYGGLMITEEGPKVIEFNARFGDPEAQVMLPLLRTPLLDILQAVVRGTLTDLEVNLHPHWVIDVVLAAPGYPVDPVLGSPIQNLDKIPTGKVLHAGTKHSAEGKVVTSGGRVLSILGQGNSLKEAMAEAYGLVSQISFDGMQYRKDIGAKAFKHLQQVAA